MSIIALQKIIADIKEKISVSQLVNLMNIQLIQVVELLKKKNVLHVNQQWKIALVVQVILFVQNAKLEYYKHHYRNA